MNKRQKRDLSRFTVFRGGIGELSTLLFVQFMNRPEQRKIDQRVIQECLAGNVESFARLVEAYQDRLFNSVARMTGNLDDAEDIVQDAFVLAFRKLDSFRGKSSFYTWIYRIAMNTAINFRRRKTRSTPLMENPQEGMEIMASLDDSPSRPLEASEEAELVQRSLLRLSDEHRQILVLREIDDLSYEDIAEVLDLPVGTVRSRLHRARLQMKDYIIELEQAKSSPT